MTPNRNVFQRIVASWLAMKPWVRNWLFFLNGVFLAAFGFWGDPAAHWILLAYLASGPLLVGFMIKQQGLTRLLGIAHLVPWLPLMVYIVLRLSSDFAGPAVHITDTPLFGGYLYLLLVCLVVCLSLDVWDVARYLRGERYVLGSQEAVRIGASRPSPSRLPCETAV